MQNNIGHMMNHQQNLQGMKEGRNRETTRLRTIAYRYQTHDDTNRSSNATSRSNKTTRGRETVRLTSSARVPRRERQRQKATGD